MVKPALTYTPGPAPTNADDLPRYISQELSKIAGALGAAFQLPTSYRPPAKPRDGMVVLADGSHWNPGSGQGYYGYRNGGWVLLG